MRNVHVHCIGGVICYVCIHVYMLGTILKPPARFKAIRTVLKPSGPFQSRPDGFEAVGAKICIQGLLPKHVHNVFKCCIYHLTLGTLKRWYCVLLAAAAVLIVIAVVFWLALIGFTATNGEFYDIVREGLVQCICGDKHTYFLLLCFMSDGLHHTCIDMQS